MIKIELQKNINANIDQVRSCLLDHDRQSRFFNAKISLQRKEDEGEQSGGKGAIRQVEMNRQVFLEEVLIATSNHIRYKIIGKGPVTDHQGDIHFSELEGEQTKIDYVIVCNGPKWAPNFLVKWIIEKDIKQALENIASYYL